MGISYHSPYFHKRLKHSLIKRCEQNCSGQKINVYEPDSNSELPICMHCPNMFNSI